MPQEPDSQHADDLALVLRPATAADQEAVIGLFSTGGGEHVDDPDGHDIRNLAENYLGEDESSCLWIAEQDGRGPVGMVAVKSAGDHIGEIRRLRVAPDMRNRGIGSRLVREALSFCRDRGFVKVILDTTVNQQAAITLFQRVGFRLNRKKISGEREKLEFYLDLYHQPDGDSH